MNDRQSKPDPYFEEARDLLHQDSANVSVEEELWLSMSLQRLATTLLEKTDVPAWGKKPINLEIAAEMATALSKIPMADHLARLLAAGTAINAEPGSEQEMEMGTLFESLSSPSRLSDAHSQAVIAQDCVSALSIINAYYNDKTKDPSRAKIAEPGDHGYNLRKIAMARLFQGALFDDPENLIDSLAVIATCSPRDSAERLAAILGLLRYPQYTDFLNGSTAECFIENLAPIGSTNRHEAEELLKIDSTFPLKDLLERTREMRREPKQ